MSLAAKIVIAKTGYYRGQQEEYSNTYSFSGTAPASPAAWQALGEAIWNSEKTFHLTNVNLTKILGYLPGDLTNGQDRRVAYYSKDYVADGTTLIPGTLAVAAGDATFAGDQAGWLRAHTGQSSKGKKVYIRKYYHFGKLGVGGGDTLDNTWKTKVTAHGALMLGGTLPGNATWCGPRGETATAPAISQFVTTRTLKRRGKRP